MTVLLPLAAAGAENAQKGAFPPLETWHFPSQIFWTLLLFGLLYFVLSRFILPKLGNTIEVRESKLADDIDTARLASDKADEAQKAAEKQMGEARAKARDLSNKTRRDIEAEINAETAKIDAAINAKVEAAEVRIAALRTDALSNVASIAEEAASAMTKRFDVTASADDIASAVKDSVVS